LCALAVGGLIFVPLGFLYHLILTILFLIILVSFLFPLYAYIMFSQKGGGFQERVYNLIIQRLGPTVKGKILDIGSGNGVLAVKLAQQHSDVEVVGIDYWGKDWEYSQKVCEQNARITHVENRVHFQRGDAATLDFADNTFDGAISNLTFHEVRSVGDKREVVREALRVVKSGGTFAFVDYFYKEKYYGSVSEFESYLRNMNLSQFEYRPLQEMMAIPVLLRHPKILGRVGIVYGRK
jgi:SAM-dependent methyltransferase